MSDQIAHQAIENVFIKLDHAIPMNSIATVRTLQNPE
jgi:hypothetical protein